MNDFLLKIINGYYFYLLKCCATCLCTENEHYFSIYIIKLNPLICIVVVVFVFNVPPKAKVIWRRGHGLKSHPTDW